MPRSRRNKVVSLTQTAKKPLRENNARLLEQVQECVDLYPRIFVFSVANMRNTYLKEVRNELSDSRLFFGKTKVMQKSLCPSGPPSPETALHPGLDRLAPYLTGSVGLLFTPRSTSEVLEFFETFSRSDYARMGHISPIELIIPAGAVGYSPEEPLPHSMETTVRALGMPTKLNKGKVWLDQDYVVCREGEKLDQKQAALLKVFGKETAEFEVTVLAGWEKEGGEVKAYGKEE